MSETVVVGLTWLVSLYLAYEGGHFKGRKMVRDEWINSMKDPDDDLLAVYDECAGIAVPARETLFEQVEAYRETIRLLRARAEKRIREERRNV